MRSMQREDLDRSSPRLGIGDEGSWAVLVDEFAGFVWGVAAAGTG